MSVFVNEYMSSIKSADHKVVIIHVDKNDLKKNIEFEKKYSEWNIQSFVFVISKKNTQ